MQSALTNDSSIIYTKTAKNIQQHETAAVSSATSNSKVLTSKLSVLTSMSSSMTSSITETASSNLMNTSTSSCASVQTAAMSISSTNQITAEEQQNIESVINQLEAADSAAASQTIADKAGEYLFSLFYIYSKS